MAILKNTPFIFNKTNDYFETLVEPKFEKLRNSMSFADYCDFILCTGGLRDWLRAEFTIDKKDMVEYFYKDDFYNIFHSVYNNLKHYRYTGVSKDLKIYIKKDGKPLSSNYEENGNAIWCDEDVCTDKSLWVEHVIGEKGMLDYVILVHYENSDVKTYWLYEICKEAYLLYKRVLYQCLTALK